MSQELLSLAELCELLADPVDHRPLVVAPADVLAALQDQQARRVLRTVAGELVLEGFEAALLRAGGDVAYLVREGVADLLEGSGVVVVSGLDT